MEKKRIISTVLSFKRRYADTRLRCSKAVRSTSVAMSCRTSPSIIMTVARRRKLLTFLTMPSNYTLEPLCHWCLRGA